MGNVDFFDGAPGIAKRLKYLLQKNDILNGGTAGNTEFIDSAEDEEIRKAKATRFYDILKR